MQKTYTTDHLIRFIYHETTPLESAEVAAELAVNARLDEEIRQMQGVLRDLDDCTLDPHPTSVRIIMEYAQNQHEPAHG